YRQLRNLNRDSALSTPCSLPYRQLRNLFVQRLMPLFGSLPHRQFIHDLKRCCLAIIEVVLRQRSPP
ncbi:hypothetical protein, partial [Pectobacterium versatile]|uniref:hypothetical protein n=1 Tax=Pectobacterium versatile TaxID=2488639 RepID=UPI001961CA6F